MPIFREVNDQLANADLFRQIDDRTIECESPWDHLAAEHIAGSIGGSYDGKNVTLHAPKYTRPESRDLLMGEALAALEQLSEEIMKIMQNDRIETNEKERWLADAATRAISQANSDEIT